MLTLNTVNNTKYEITSCQVQIKLICINFCDNIIMINIHLYKNTNQSCTSKINM